MKKSWLYWMIPALLVSVLFFGCGRQPGEKLYQNALSQWEKGHLVRARTLLEKSIRRRTGSVENADAYNRLGLLLWEMGEVDPAAEAFQESIQMDASDYAVLSNLGVALTAKKDFPAAENAFREAALLQPGDSRPLAYIGMIYVQNQNWNEAARHVQQAITQLPDNPQLQTALALTELQTLGAASALHRLQTLIQKNPTFAPALFNMASIYRHELHNPDKARIWLERYLKQSSEDDPFHIVALAELKTDRPEKTPKLTFTPPQTRDRKKAEQLFKKALASHRKGNLPQAIKEYIQTIETDDLYEQAFYNLGLAYYASNQMVLASEAFNHAVKLSPAFVDARYNAALVAYYHLGQTEWALRELQIIQTQQPDYQPATDLIARIKK